MSEAGIRRRTGGAIVATLCVGYVASQFYRSANAVIAPDLMSELSISAEAMGVVTGSFFLAFALVQVPCGVLLDRFGPRIVMPAVLLSAVAGSLVFAAAEGVAGLAAGRVLMGIGCAVGLMGSLVVFARWFPVDRFATLSALLFSVGGAGNLLATTPLAAASGSLGWRGAFVAMALATLGMAALLYLAVRDAPPGHPALNREPETPRQILAGLRQVIAMRDIWLIVAMQLVAYPTIMTILGLWAGPYLADVHGLDTVARGNVLFVMTVATLAATMAYGPLDRYFDTRKRIVQVGALLTCAVLLALALLPDLSLVSATVLLVAMSVFGGYHMMLHAHARSVLPEHLVGRGLTLQNMAAIGSVFLLQSASGQIVGAVTRNGGTPDTAYRLVFGFLAGLLIVALATYSRIRDARPSRSEA